MTETESNDFRALIRPFPELAEKLFTDNSILRALKSTGGLMFPFTPSVSNSGSLINYEYYSNIHSNTDHATFSRNGASQLTLLGEFTSSTTTQALYNLACVHFLRSITKMRFGDNDENTGSPPPMLLFSAFGWYMYNNVPVMLTDFTITLDSNSTYIPINLTSLNYSEIITASESFTVSNSNDVVWIPAKMSITVSLTTQIQPKTLQNNFDLNSFKSGKLLLNKGDKGYTGGWL